MSICLIVMTDGREHITDAIKSAEANLSGPITQRIIHDDSGDDAHRAWLARTFPDYRVIYRQHRLGFSGAYANAWRFLAQQPERWVFSTEDDFVFNREVDLEELMCCLMQRRNLLQMALRRQAWNPTEKAAGGLIESNPGAYVDSTAPLMLLGGRDVDWLEHREFWTTNPSLFSRELCEVGWPETAASEGHFTRVLTASPETRFGYWGQRDDDPWVTHIGTERIGFGY